MALAHSLHEQRSFFREPYFPPPVTFSPDHLDSIQSLYQVLALHKKNNISIILTALLATWLLT